MRTSRGHSKHHAGSARGFSLLEIVVVLTLGAILVGGALAYMSFSSSERHLKTSARDIEILAKKARTLAMLQQTTYSLVIGGDGIHLMPYAEALQQAQTASQRKANKKIGNDNDNATSANPRFNPVHGEWIPQEDDHLAIRRWASDNWIAADDKANEIWRFEPDGTCEPVSIRLSVGTNYFIENTYHPLTGSIREDQTILQAGK